MKNIRAQLSVLPLGIPRLILDYMVILGIRHIFNWLFKYVLMYCMWYIEGLEECIGTQVGRFIYSR